MKEGPFKFGNQATRQLPSSRPLSRTSAKGRKLNTAILAGGRRASQHSCKSSSSAVAGVHCLKVRGIALDPDLGARRQPCRVLSCQRNKAGFDPWLELARRVMPSAHEAAAVSQMQPSLGRRPWPPLVGLVDIPQPKLELVVSNS
jgi:hypothetical protein